MTLAESGCNRRHNRKPFWLRPQHRLAALFRTSVFRKSVCKQRGISSYHDNLLTPTAATAVEASTMEASAVKSATETSLTASGEISGRAAVVDAAECAGANAGAAARLREPTIIASAFASSAFAAESAAAAHIGVASVVSAAIKEGGASARNRVRDYRKAGGDTSRLPRNANPIRNRKRERWESRYRNKAGTPHQMPGTCTQ